ncbi:F-box/LRR-repeat protein 14 [Typha angustifolia]|uniref:F-box/LRR-repeat protein 14 n=1 Tax=Typha angustifolia TaxID=59011 RepID=UPI003C2B269D
MEALPDTLLLDIVKRITRTSDRSSFSLGSKRLYAIEAEGREFIRVGCGLHPATEALTSLCMRFPNLRKVEIVYSGWMSNLGKQLDNNAILVLSSHCPGLTDLTLSFCSFITDSGLGYLASCKNLRSLKLNFTPAISSNGILSLVVGCKNLSCLRLIRCMRVNSVEWLEYLGKLGTLEELLIKNCRAIGEDDLIRLGPGWKSLKRLEFEVDAYHRLPKVHDHLSADRWRRSDFLCENLKELSLVNCIIDSGRGLSFLLGKCKALEKLHLDMCVGLKDSDMVALSQMARNLKSISLRLPSQYLAPILVNIPLRLTDNGLKELASGCSMLEVVELSFSDSEFPTLCCFTQEGVLTLIKSCPIRVLVLYCAYFFNDAGMKALRRLQFLETLELVKCQEVTDAGIQLIIHFPRLTNLTLCRCLGVSDIGLEPLVGSRKLESLTVKDCPQVSQEGVEGAARSVSYMQDMSWLY